MSLYLLGSEREAEAEALRRRMRGGCGGEEASAVGLYRRRRELEEGAAEARREYEECLLKLQVICASCRCKKCKKILFVCLFIDGFMSGRCYFFTSNWMQKTCSVFLLLGPALRRIHSPQMYYFLF